MVPAADNRWEALRYSTCRWNGDPASTRLPTTMAPVNNHVIVEDQSSIAHRNFLVNRRRNKLGKWLFLDPVLKSILAAVLAKQNQISKVPRAPRNLIRLMRGYGTLAMRKP
jgi:hypothetical protein